MYGLIFGIAPGAIDPEQPEAEPEFGHYDGLNRWYGEFEPPDDEEEDPDYHPGASVKVAYQNPHDSIPSKSVKRQRSDGQTSSRCKRPRARNQSEASSAEETLGETLYRAFRQRTSKQMIGEECCDQDDEESLPTDAGPVIKEEPAIMQESGRTQASIPPKEESSNRSPATDVDTKPPTHRIQTIDLTADADDHTEIKVEAAPEATATHTPNDNDYEIDFDLLRREAEVERDFQRRLIEIDRRERAYARRQQAGNGTR